MAMARDMPTGTGHLSVVLGDLFDGDAETLVVPCSTNGTMSAEIRSHVRALGVRLTPKGLKPGEVIPAPVAESRGTARIILFAAVVAAEGATSDIVKSAARQVGEFVSANGGVTAFPLLGAGAGGLLPEDSVRAMSAGFFSAAPQDATMRIHVLSQDLYVRLLSVSRDMARPDREVSPSVRQAVLRLERAGPVPAESLVSAILEIHPEYGADTAGQIELGEDKDSVRKPVHDWLEEVSALFDENRVSVLHGRLVIIGLSLIAPALRQKLAEGAFLDSLVNELKEPLDTLLTPLGVELHTGRKTSREAEQEEVVPTHTDNPAIVDELGRKGFARILATRIRDVRAEETKNAVANRDNSGGPPGGGAFLVHLHAPWGAGKTSLLNFLADELRKPDPERWVVVGFNAWRHQRIAPPWWWLMTTMYAEAVRELSRFDRSRAVWLRLREWWWRVRGGWPGYLALLICAAVLVMALTTGFLKEMASKNLLSLETAKGLLITVAAIATPALTLWGLLRAVSRWIFATSARGARRFIDNTHDPMRLVHEHLRHLVDWIRYEVVILIDDLDRCQAPYVVELLEGIQTLFRDVPITYVIAADRDWLSDSYAKEYDGFESVTEDPGRPAGYLFLEKTFQISAPLPSAGPRLDTYWARLLRSSALPSEGDLERARMAAKEELGDRQTKEARRLVQENPGTTPAEVQARRETVAIEMVTERAAQSHSHTLEPFRKLLGRDPNPRMMKRLVNAYGIARGVETLRGYNLQDDPKKEQETALWTLLNLRWPKLGSYLALYREHVDAIGETQLPSELPEHLRPLFHDPEVASVVSGDADNIDAQLNVSRMQAILNSSEGDSSSLSRSTALV